MVIKRGNVVSHAVAVEWGIGKVMEVTAIRATIEFTDGVVRKIVSSHYPSLVQADPASFVSKPAIVPVAKVRATRAKKVKTAAL